MIHPRTWAWLVLSLGLASAGAGEELDPKVNVAAKRWLPQGKGLAANYENARAMGDHPEVIFADPFESREKVQGEWDEARNASTVLSLVPGGADGGKALRVEATLGEDTGGGLTRWFDSSEVVFVRFYAKFDSQCDYVHHFVTLRANRGLQGKDKWSGFGGAGLKPAGDDRFSTALEPWGNWGRWEPPGKWNFYSYWHQMKASPDGKYWGNGFRPEKQPLIQKGRWICAEFMLKHNTPGKADGEQAYWIDGELRGHWRGIPWRTSETLWANALTLEAYITDRWTKQKTNTVYFDNVVVAKAYVGPLGVEKGG